MSTADTPGSAPDSAPISLSALADAIHLDPDFRRFGSNPVSRIRAGHTLGDIETAEPGDVVVLDAGLHHEVPTYRFDLAVGRAPIGVAAIVGGRPGATGRRTAAGQGIAIATLAPDHDVASLAVLLRDLSRGGQQPEIAVLERICLAADDCDDADDIEELLSRVAQAMGRPVQLVRAATGPGDLPIRIQGLVRWHLTVEGPAATALLGSALSYLARRIESVLQADYEAKRLPEATRSELVNEILLSDAGTSADATGRLRRAGFPIDGSHCAIRIDCHDQSPGGASTAGAPASGPSGTALTTYRAQQQIADLTIDGARRAGGAWTRAGTATSIVLVSTRTTSHGELVSPEVEEAALLAIEAAASVLPDLQIYVGVGTPHLGVAGLRSSVNEATTAVRSARDRGNPNQPHHFDRLGFSRALLQWAEIDGVRPVMTEILAPLVDQPPQRAKEAIDTLRIYLETGRNVSATADALHLHRNTVRYRIDRIRAKLAVDLDDPDERLLVELGCRLAASDREG